MNQLRNGSAFIESDNSAVTDARADGVQFFESEWCVEQMRRDNTSQRSADDDPSNCAIAQAAPKLF